MTKRRNRGDGNIERRGADKWRLRYYAHGKQVKVSFTGTEAEARKELKTLTNAVNVGEHIDPVKTTLATWAESWLAILERDPEKRRGLVNVRTRERYQQLLGHVLPTLGEAQLQKLTSMAIDKVYLALEKDLAPRTVHHVHTVLKACLTEAVRQRMLKYNPADTAHPPRPDNDNIATILDEDQMIKLRNGFRGHAIEGIVMVALMTGMRRNEIVALRHCDVDLDKGLIMVTRAVEETSKGRWIKPPKTARGNRTISIDPVLISKLREIWDQHRRLTAGVPDGSSINLSMIKLDPETLLFPGEGDDLTKLRDPRSVTRVFIRMAEKVLGIKMRLHDLRASHLTFLIDSGTPIPTVAARAGHHPTVLLSNYAKWTKKGDNKAAEILAGFSKSMA
jgi:integrase